MYYNFTVGNDTYRLRLTTRDLVDLEAKLGMNAILIFGLSKDHPRIPTTAELVTIVTQSFKSLNHGIKDEDVYDILDKWVDEGHLVTELTEVVVHIYEGSGLVPKGEETESKN